MMESWKKQENASSKNVRYGCLPQQREWALQGTPQALVQLITYA
ncbi:hypothetical protein [Sinomicrobium sp. M5D2P9]